MKKHFFAFTFKKNKPIKAERGFTIIETLVAIFILLLAITGPMAIVAQSIRSSIYARDQIVAFYLAQEAIEQLRNLRDEGVLAMRRSDGSVSSWDAKLPLSSDTCGSGQPCGLDISKIDGSYRFSICNTSPCAPLSFDEGLYGLSGGPGNAGTVSKFSRTIYIKTLQLNSGGVDDLKAPEQRQVKVVITWPSPGGTLNTFVLNEVLNNWGLQ